MPRTKLKPKAKSMHKGVIPKAPYKGLLVRENLFMSLVFTIVSRINNDR